MLRSFRFEPSPDFHEGEVVAVLSFCGAEVVVAAMVRECGRFQNEVVWEEEDPFAAPALQSPSCLFATAAEQSSLTCRSAAEDAEPAAVITAPERSMTATSAPFFQSANGRFSISRTVKVPGY